ncbi:3-methyl-2-oxobutanoate hydroxymethyltransferase [Mycolicibacterium aubagnense]
MLTAYDYSSARIFDDAEIPVLLVGDSAANVVYGYDTTLPITIDELIPLARAVVKGAPHALVVADLPFGSYKEGPRQALSTATRFMKETGAHAVKLEGGERMVEQIAALTQAGMPVVAHIGFTPQSVNGLGGFRVQGRGDAGDQTVHDAIAVAEAGAIAVVLEYGARRAGHPDHRQADHPHRRHRGRRQLRRAGAGVAGHGGHDGRKDRQVRQALRRRRGRIGPCRTAIRRRGSVQRVPRRGTLLLSTTVWAVQANPRKCLHSPHTGQENSGLRLPTKAPTPSLPSADDAHVAISRPSRSSWVS